MAGTITLESALPTLEENFTIMGPGSSRLTVERDQAAANFRIFNIDDSSLTCSITGMALEFGSAPGTDAGGAIRNLGNLTLNDCMFYGYTAAYGGAIYNHGNLPASACYFYENGATRDYGGAIYNDGTGTLTLASNSQVSANSAARSGGGIYNNAGTVIIRDSTTIGGNFALWGGGIFNYGGNVQMNGGSFGDNHATQATGVTDSGRGGGYYGDGGGTVTFTGVTFSGNIADNRGGGFYLKSGSLTLDGCNIGGNSSPTGPGGYVERGTTYTRMPNCQVRDVIVVET